MRERFPHLKNWTIEGEPDTTGRSLVCGHIYGDPAGDPDGKHVKILGRLQVFERNQLLVTPMYTYFMSHDEKYQSELPN